MTGTNDPCKGGVILFSLKNLRYDTDKKKFLEETIDTCAKKKLKKEGQSISKTKGKRKMSGYNCFMKTCASQPNKDFQQCLTEKGWANLSDSEKEKYNKMAQEGCD